jgi:hypothetical protein
MYKNMREHERKSENMRELERRENMREHERTSENMREHERAHEKTRWYVRNLYNFFKLCVKNITCMHVF